MSIWLSQGFNAVSLGSILLLIAIGLTFSFGLMNVINMAHGELIMVGAYVAYVCQRQMDTLLGSSGSTSICSYRCRLRSWSPRPWVRCWSAC